MHLHRKLADRANWVEVVDDETKHNEEKCARHHHQTMLEMGREVKIRMGEVQRRSTHANLPDGDF